MDYAVIETGGKQLRVKVGDEVFVEKLNLKEKEKVSFEKVVYLGGEKAKIGTPYVKGATVTGEVVKNGKGKKITIFKMRPRKGYRLKKGHRQPYTKVKIKKISE